MDCDVVSTRCAFDIKVGVLEERNKMTEQDIGKEEEGRQKWAFSCQ